MILCWLSDLLALYTRSNSNFLDYNFHRVAGVSLDPTTLPSLNPCQGAQVEYSSYNLLLFLFRNTIIFMQNNVFKKDIDEYFYIKRNVKRRKFTSVSVS